MQDLGNETQLDPEHMEVDLPPRNLESILADVAMQSTPKKKPPSDLVSRILEAQARASPQKTCVA